MFAVQLLIQQITVLLETNSAMISFTAFSSNRYSEMSTLQGFVSLSVVVCMSPSNAKYNLTCKVL